MCGDISIGDAYKGAVCVSAHDLGLRPQTLHAQLQLIMIDHDHDVMIMTRRPPNSVPATNSATARARACMHACACMRMHFQNL